jgi:hypothetical protein
VHKLAGDGLNFVIACFAAQTSCTCSTNAFSTTSDSSTLSIRLEVHLSTCTLKEAVQRQKESHGGTPHPSGDRRRPPPPRYPCRMHLSTSIAERLSIPCACPCVFAPRFLSPDFVPDSTRIFSRAKLPSQIRPPLPDHFSPHAW